MIGVVDCKIILFSTTHPTDRHTHTHNIYKLTHTTHTCTHTTHTCLIWPNKWGVGVGWGVGGHGPCDVHKTKFSLILDHHSHHSLCLYHSALSNNDGTHTDTQSSFLSLCTCRCIPCTYAQLCNFDLFHTCTCMFEGH